MAFVVRSASTNTATADTSDTAERVLYSYSDDNGLLETVTTGSTEYSFTYDAFGNTDSTQVGGQTVVAYEYNDKNGKLKTVTYANGFSEEYVYDTLDRIKEIWHTVDNTHTKAFSYTYTADGYLRSYTDHVAGKTTHYGYDVAGRLQYVIESADTYDADSQYLYNSYGSPSQRYNNLSYASGTSQYEGRISYTYAYDSNQHLTSVHIGAQTSANIAYAYDSFDRLTQKTLTTTGFTSQVDVTYRTKMVQLSWISFQTRTDALVSKYTSTINGTVANEYTYTYDANGNITKITYADGKTVTYTYDDLGQLLTEVNEVIGRSYTYTYDKAGNRLTTVEENTTAGYTLSYTHEYENTVWGDMLTAHRDGMEHTYDELGNLINYMTANDLSLFWTGRQLTAVGSSWFYETYEYNDLGQRISKTRDGVTTEYIYDGDRLLAEVNPSKILLFLYDESNTPIGMRYRSHTDTDYTTFWFEKNLQGDIVAVYSADGVKQVSYAYDAWGMPFYTTHVSGTKAYENPFLYRGYYYEYDLTLYRTQTRLYDPYMGRFVSPDLLDVIAATPMGLTDKNLYLYCDNNPITRVDPDGEFWNFIIGGVVGGIVGGVVAALNGEDATGIIVGILAGAASGVVAASGLGIIAQASISAGISAGADFANQTADIIQSNDSFSNYNIRQTFAETVYGFGTSVVGSLLGQAVDDMLIHNLSKSKALFDSYLEKTFTAGLRKEVGKSSSALLRQADRFLQQSNFYLNAFRGASSVIGSCVSLWNIAR